MQVKRLFSEIDSGARSHSPDSESSESSYGRESKNAFCRSLEQKTGSIQAVHDLETSAHPASIGNTDLGTRRVEIFHFSIGTGFNLNHLFPKYLSAIEKDLISQNVNHSILQIHVDPVLLDEIPEYKDSFAETETSIDIVMKNVGWVKDAEGEGYQVYTKNKRISELYNFCWDFRASPNPEFDAVANFFEKKLASGAKIFVSHYCDRFYYDRKIGELFNRLKPIYQDKIHLILSNGDAGLKLFEHPLKDLSFDEFLYDFGYLECFDRKKYEELGEAALVEILDEVYGADALELTDQDIRQEKLKALKSYIDNHPNMDREQEWRHVNHSLEDYQPTDLEESYYSDYETAEGS